MTVLPSALAAPADVVDATTDMDAVVDDDVPADALRPPVIARTQPEAVLAQRRRSCAFEAGAWPAETLGAEVPIGDAIPVQHVLVTMQENRSFDRYLGRLVAQGYYRAGDFTTGADGGVGEGFAHSDEVDDPPPGWSNPDARGAPVYPHPDTEFCYGVNHSWRDMHDDYNDGRMDHFVTNNDPNGQRGSERSANSRVLLTTRVLVTGADPCQMAGALDALCTAIKRMWPNWSRRSVALASDL